MVRPVIEGLFIGKVEQTAQGLSSALNKRLHTEPVWLDSLGLAGDEQGDLRFHGGSERAVHHYPAEHYAYWAQRYPERDWQQPAFGENLSTHGLSESQVCIGDLFRWGDAILQVSQPRSPCYRLGLRWGVPQLAPDMQENSRCGWFYRVLRPGLVGIDQPFELVQRSYPGLSVAQALRSYFNYPLERAGLQQLLGCEALSERWRQTVARRLQSNQLEEWENRLFGPAQTRLSA